MFCTLMMRLLYFQAIGSALALVFHIACFRNGIVTSGPIFIFWLVDTGLATNSVFCTSAFVKLIICLVDQSLTPPQ